MIPSLKSPELSFFAPEAAVEGLAGWGLETDEVTAFDLADEMGLEGVSIRPLTSFLVWTTVFERSLFMTVTVLVTTVFAAWVFLGFTVFADAFSTGFLDSSELRCLSLPIHVLSSAFFWGEDWVLETGLLPRVCSLAGVAWVSGAFAASAFEVCGLTVADFFRGDFVGDASTFFTSGFLVSFLKTSILLVFGLLLAVLDGDALTGDALTGDTLFAGEELPIGLMKLVGFADFYFYGEERGLEAPSLLCMIPITDASLRVFIMVMSSALFKLSSFRDAEKMFFQMFWIVQSFSLFQLTFLKDFYICFSF